MGTVVTIDTEGFDAFVLLGAARTLASGSVGYIEFEYHKFHPWNMFLLRWVIDFLSNLNFDCYFAGNDGRAYRITSCFRSSFEFHEWSNVVCASRNHRKVAKA